VGRDAADGRRNLGIVGAAVGLAGAVRLSLASEAKHWLREAMAPRGGDLLD
jgi:hypothetical protein